jgi:hypothetical protein
MTMVQDGQSPTPTTIQQDRVEASAEGEVVSSERHQGGCKCIILPQESSRHQ